jgi:hypothetical protein
LAFQLSYISQTVADMKTKLILFGLLIGLASCDVLIVEPVYDDRDRISGSYKVEEHSQTYNDYTRFYIYIRKSGFNDGIIIENFYDAGVNIRASVVYDKIYINRQIVNGYEVEGVGTLYGNEIQFSYRVRDTYSSHKPTDFCSATAWFY